MTQKSFECDAAVCRALSLCQSSFSAFRRYVLVCFSVIWVLNEGLRFSHAKLPGQTASRRPSERQTVMIPISSTIPAPHTAGTDKREGCEWAGQQVSWPCPSWRVSLSGSLRDCAMWPRAFRSEEVCVVGGGGGGVKDRQRDKSVRPPPDRLGQASSRPGAVRGQPVAGRVRKMGWAMGPLRVRGCQTLALKIWKGAKSLMLHEAGFSPFWFMLGVRSGRFVRGKKKSATSSL